MKRLLIFLIGFFLLSQSYSQNPELFKTWYLYSIYLEGQQDAYNIWEVEPSIYPSLTITEGLEYSGQGACNTFSGQFSYNNGLLFIDSFIPTNNTCDFQSHIQFESYYFSFLMEGTDLQIDYIDETGLILSSPLFQSMQFSSVPLGTSENIISEVKLYPNPASDKLFISFKNSNLDKIMVYSISGEKVLEVLDFENSIDVSRLSKGMYFLEIISAEGRMVQKFIKN